MEVGGENEVRMTPTFCWHNVSEIDATSFGTPIVTYADTETEDGDVGQESRS